MDLSETGPGLSQQLNTLLGWVVVAFWQEAFGKLSLEVGVPRLGNVLPARKEQPLEGAVGAMQGAVHIMTLGALHSL